MDEQTITLLKECNLGCKMAVGSICQLKEFVRNAALGEVMEIGRASCRERV